MLFNMDECKVMHFGYNNPQTNYRYVYGGNSATSH